MNRWATAYILASAVAATVVACGGEVSTSSIDASAPRDASSDESAHPDATVADALADATDAAADTSDGSTDSTVDADSSADSSSDADSDSGPIDAGTSSLLLTAITAPDAVFGTTFAAGAWSPLTQIGNSFYGTLSGGVAALPDGRGIVVLRGGDMNYPQSTVWSGVWPALTTFDTSQGDQVSTPAATASGAVAVEQSGGSGPMLLDTFEDTTSAWSTGESTDAGSSPGSVPVVIVEASGDPLVLFTNYNGVLAYQWIERSGGTWSSTANIPVMTVSQANPLIGAAKRVGADDIVAVFLVGSVGDYTLQSTTFSNGTWSTPPLVVAYDVLAEPLEGTVSVAPMLDGRVALAYVTTANAVNVGFFDGAAWSAFVPAPSVTVGGGTNPISIAPGASGAALDLVFLDSNFYVEHTRLTDDATWSWTLPMVVDSAWQYDFVSLARTP